MPCKTRDVSFGRIASGAYIVEHFKMCKYDVKLHDLGPELRICSHEPDWPCPECPFALSARNALIRLLKEKSLKRGIIPLLNLLTFIVSNSALDKQVNIKD